MVGRSSGYGRGQKVVSHFMKCETGHQLRASCLNLRFGTTNPSKNTKLLFPLRLGTASPSMFNTAPQAGGRDCGEPSIQHSCFSRYSMQKKLTSSDESVGQSG